MNEILIIQFIALYFTNLILDYPLQGTFLATGKQESNYLLWVHSAIWGFGVSLVLVPLGLFSLSKVVMLVCGHFIIDYWKARRLYKDGLILSDDEALLIDQILHVIQLLFWSKLIRYLACLTNSYYFSLFSLF